MSTPYHCDVCNIDVKQKGCHFKSKTHIENTRKLEELQGEDKKTVYEYHCEKCNYNTNLKRSWEKHIKSNKHLYTKEECVEMQRKQGEESSKIGNENEIYVERIFQELVEMKKIEQVERLGHISGHKFDIKIKFYEEAFFRGMQIKTLILRQNGYYCTLKHKNRYEDDTLIVAIDKEKTKFVLIPYYYLKHTTGVNFVFKNNTESKYSKYEYTNLQKFKESLIELSKNTTVIKEDISNYITHNNLSEYKMIQLLKEICETKNLQFSHNLSASEQTDCNINQYTVQCKSSLCKSFNQYKFHIHKKCSQIHIPYSIDDGIEFFIFHPSETSDFYIVPISKLIEMGYITTPNNTGKTDISLNVKETKVTDLTPWNFEYLNRFDLLHRNKPKLKLTYKIGFDKQLYIHQIPYTIMSRSNDTFIDIINSKKVKYSASTNDQNKTGLFTFAITTIIDGVKITFAESYYDFLICEIINDHDLYYIIPRNIIFLQGIQNSTKVRIALPNYKDNHWSKEYLNRFDLLK